MYLTQPIAGLNTWLKKNSTSTSISLNTPSPTFLLTLFGYNIPVKIFFFFLLQIKPRTYFSMQTECLNEHTCTSMWQASYMYLKQFVGFSNRGRPCIASSPQSRLKVQVFTVALVPIYPHTHTTTNTPTHPHIPSMSQYFLIIFLISQSHADV